MRHVPATSVREKRLENQSEVRTDHQAKQTKYRDNYLLLMFFHRNNSVHGGIIVPLQLEVFIFVNFVLILMQCCCRNLISVITTETLVCLNITCLYN